MTLLKPRYEMMFLVGVIFLQSTCQYFVKNTPSGIIRDAYEQLNSFEANQSAFRLGWFAATSRTQEAKCLQLESALYGTTRIIDMAAPDKGHLPCYFFRNSEFFRYKNLLDAAILSTHNSAKLCLNTLSPRYNSFKRTQLYIRFITELCDPLVEEAVGKAYIVDSDINRSDVAAVMDYLQIKYESQRLMNIDLGYISATVKIL